MAGFRRDYLQKVARVVRDDCGAELTPQQTEDQLKQALRKIRAALCNAGHKPPNGAVRLMAWLVVKGFTDEQIEALWDQS